MTLERPPVVVCPHCGFEADIEELCTVCGKFVHGDIPGSKVSVVHTLDNFLSKMKEKGFHGVDIDDELQEDLWNDPGWSTLTGNLFNHDKD